LMQASLTMYVMTLLPLSIGRARPVTTI